MVVSNSDRGAAELIVVLYDSGRERVVVLAPILSAAECRDCGAAWDVLLFPCVCAEMHHSGRPSEHSHTAVFVPVQIAGCSWKSCKGK